MKPAARTPAALTIRRCQTTATLLALLALPTLSGCGGSGDKLGLGLNNIGTPPPTNNTPPASFVPLSQYVGTWNGTWRDPFGPNAFNSSGQPIGQAGTLSLTVGSDGHVTGTVTDTTTGETGSLTEDMIVSNGKTQGLVTNISCTLGGTTLTGGASNTVDPQNHWSGVFKIPPLPSEANLAPSNNPNATIDHEDAQYYDLAKQ